MCSGCRSLWIGELRVPWETSTHPWLPLAEQAAADPCARCQVPWPAALLSSPPPTPPFSSSSLEAPTANPHLSLPSGRFTSYLFLRFHC